MNLQDNQTLIGACTEFGNPIRTYDDGFGSLWVYEESHGASGIVRAMDFTSSWNIVVDEILQPVPDEDVIEAYGYYVLPDDVFSRGTAGEWYAMKGCGEKLATFSTEREATAYCVAGIERTEAELVEGYEYQPNATGTGIVCLDVNHHALRPFGPERQSGECNVILIIETDD